MKCYVLVLENKIVSIVFDSQYATPEYTCCEIDSSLVEVVNESVTGCNVNYITTPLENLSVIDSKVVANVSNVSNHRNL